MHLIRWLAWEERYNFHEREKDDRHRAPARARVSKYDARRGVATAIVKETGRSIRLSWQILAHAPVLSPGMEVLISVDEEDQPKAVLLSG
jgi:hypothetical protein